MIEFTSGAWNIHHASIDNQPFVVTPDDGSAPWVAFGQNVSAGDKIIADVSMNAAKAGFPHVDNVNECKANARLIAAAPELLEALKLFASYGDVFAYHKDNENPYRKALAAIAKAEGKQ